MRTKHLFLAFFLTTFLYANAGNNRGRSDSLNFTITKKIESTQVKNQYKSNTCWSYSVLGMLESVLIKKGNPISLSEMFIVYYTYISKAERFIRMQGKSNFSGGGALNDPIEVMHHFGIVPEEIYTGLPNGEINHDHIAMDAELKDYVTELIKQNPIDTNWKQNFTAILDKYMGSPPTRFTYKGVQYTPQSYAASLGLEIDNYVMLSSFMYKPYYCRFVIEVPDNWSFGMAYNFPIDELLKIIDSSLEYDYPVAIAGDISENGFRWDKGIATLAPPDSLLEPKGTLISAAMRQKAFDIHETTDDHGMLITGLGKDQFNSKYYLVKNSWGTSGTEHKGYIFMSEPYLSYKLITVMVNKKHIPADLFKKLDPCCVK